jgi:integrase
MATFKAEIQNKRADGTYNVRVRVTHNRQIRRISTHIFVTEEDITRSKKIKNEEIAEACNDLIRDCRAACNALGYKIDGMPIDLLVENIKTHLKGGEVFKLNFFDYTREKMESMPEGTAGVYGNMLSALKRYIKSESLDILDIRADFLKEFQRFLESEPSQRGSNRKKGKDKKEAKNGRAVSLYLSNIRSIHNKAKKDYNDEDRGVIRIPYSPFEHFSIPQQKRTRKRAIPVETIQSIIDIPYRKEIVGGRWNLFNLAKDCFLLSFALIGMNSADMFYSIKHKNDIVVYNRKKTMTRRDDQAEMKVRIEKCIKPLIEKYNDPIGNHLFRFYRHYANPNNFNHALNDGLKEVGKAIGVEDLEFYAARHSWATIGRSAKVGIEKYTIHEGLNHAPEKEMKATEIYIDRDWSLIWNANKKILSLFDWSFFK